MPASVAQTRAGRASPALRWRHGRLKQWSFTVKSRTVRRSSGEYLAELLRNQHLSPEELARLQSRRAASIARFAADSTGFYRRLFDEHGIDVARLEDPAEWERIPITERAQVKEHDADLRPANSERFAREALTGGSTGVPLRTAHDSRVPTLALAWRMYSWWGVQPWDDLARLGRGVSGASRRCATASNGGRRSRSTSTPASSTPIRCGGSIARSCGHGPPSSRATWAPCWSSPTSSTPTD